MKTIIAGSRGFHDFELLQRICRGHVITEVVSGGARGADLLGERYAADSGIPIQRFPVTADDWKRLGKAAGPIRNKAMADYAEALIAFWDGVSPGTRNMIELATKRFTTRNLSETSASRVTVVMYVDDLLPRARARARKR